MQYITFYFFLSIPSTNSFYLKFVIYSHFLCNLYVLKWPRTERAMKLLRLCFLKNLVRLTYSTEWYWRLVDRRYSRGNYTMSCPPLQCHHSKSSLPRNQQEGFWYILNPVCPTLNFLSSFIAYLLHLLTPLFLFISPCFLVSRIKVLLRLVFKLTIHLLTPTFPTLFPIPLFIYSALQPNHTIDYFPWTSSEGSDVLSPPFSYVQMLLILKGCVEMPHAKYCGL